MLRAVSIDETLSSVRKTNTKGAPSSRSVKSEYLRETSFAFKTSKGWSSSWKLLKAWLATPISKQDVLPMREKSCIKIMFPVPLQFECRSLEENFGHFAREQAVRNLWWLGGVLAICIASEFLFTAATTTDFAPTNSLPHFLYTFSSSAIILFGLSVTVLTWFWDPFVSAYSEIIVACGGTAICFLLVFFSDHFRVAQLAGALPEEVWNRVDFSDGPLLLGLNAILWGISIFLPVRAVCLWPVCISAVVFYEGCSFVLDSPSGPRPSVLNVGFMIFLAYLSLTGKRALESQLRFQFIDVYRAAVKIANLERKVDEFDRKKFANTGLERIVDGLKFAQERLEYVHTCIQDEFPELATQLALGTSGIDAALVDISDVDTIFQLDPEALHFQLRSIINSNDDSATRFITENYSKSYTRRRVSNIDRYETKSSVTKSLHSSTPISTRDFSRRRLRFASLPNRNPRKSTELKSRYPNTVESEEFNSSLSGTPSSIRHTRINIHSRIFESLSPVSVERRNYSAPNTPGKKTTQLGWVRQPNDDSTELPHGLGNFWNLDLRPFGPQALIQVGKLALLPVTQHNQFCSSESVSLFLIAIKDLYCENAYHNALHGAQVCHATMWLSKSVGVWELLNEIEKFATIVSALVHDVAHPGRNNLFLINTSHALAITYNDKSVLENFHAATTFRIIQSKDTCIVENLGVEEKKAFRKLVIEMVLETDMSQHFEAIAKFKVRKSAGMNIQECPEDRWAVQKMNLKTADIGHGALEWTLHKGFADSCIEEFFAQGDEERRLELPISPLCDRNKVNEVPKSQMGFLQIICYETFVELEELQDPNTDKEISMKENCVEVIAKNISMWQKQDFS